MADFKRKTFDNCYLYQLEQNKNNKNLVNYILTADRIDKQSTAFRGIVEEEKRRQRSSILHTVMMMNKVELCIGHVELPRSFKVFEAKDIRLGKNAETKIFIDVTNLIQLKDGYFVCPKIDVLITYLFNALGYLLYSESPDKLLNNSNITIAGTECFVAMFNFIIDYLRVIGFSQNKERISYLAALYFQKNVLGKDLDTYSKNMAARVAGINSTDIKAFDLYFEESDFEDINIFLSMITSTFKLKGLTTEVFVSKWMYLYGVGTQYATEFFPAFSSVIISAYCGSYIVNQKQVERCCGRSMVTFCESIVRMGNDEFDRRRFMSESEYDKTVPRSKDTLLLMEALFKSGRKLPKEMKFTKDDFKSKATTKEKLTKIIDFYLEAMKPDKLSKEIKSIAYGAIGAMGQYNETGADIYENGVAETIVRTGKKHINAKDSSTLYAEIMTSINVLPDSITKLRDSDKAEDKEKAKRFAKSLVELRKCANLLK